MFCFFIPQVAWKNFTCGERDSRQGVGRQQVHHCENAELQRKSFALERTRVWGKMKKVYICLQNMIIDSYKVIIADLEHKVALSIEDREHNVQLVCKTNTWIIMWFNWNVRNDHQHNVSFYIYSIYFRCYSVPSSRSTLARQMNIGRYKQYKY